MKKIPLILSLSLVCFTFCLGQNQDESYSTLVSLFKKGQNVSITGYGYPEVGFTTINDKFSVVVGGGGGMLINQSFYLGLFGTGITNKPSLNDNEYIRGGWGGLQLGYTPDMKDLLHLNFAVNLGYGAFSVKDKNVVDNKDKKKNLETIQAFVITPRVGIELNVTKFFVLNIGGGYRWVYSNDTKDKLKDVNLSGIVGYLTFKFGKFGKSGKYESGKF